jgi:DNA polymerase-3 subunit gamma/tau
MSYLVMARKWRPKNFEEMVGQEHIAQTLRNAIASGRVSHAYLFTGTRGVGKTTAARILAKALNCLKGPTATPCETCDNCVAVNRGASMDVLEIDGASNNSVDNIRELREQVAYAPMQGGYKIYIIDEVHMLSKAAFNALLKTLEEPPPHVVFIFATTESGKVPHTILSRVQRFDFKRISEAAIRERLEYICEQEGVKPERAALEALARKADGSMRDALSLFDRVYAFAGSQLTLEAARKALGIPAETLFDDLLRHLSAHEPGGCLATLGAVYEDGLEVSEFLTGFGEYLRDLLFSRQPGVTPALLGLGETRFAEMRALAGDLQDGDILRYAKIVSDLIAGLKTAPHPRLWVELGLARMAALDRVVTLSQLMGQDTPPVTTHAAAVPPAEDKKKSPELTEPGQGGGEALGHAPEPAPESNQEAPEAAREEPHAPDPDPEPGFREFPPSPSLEGDDAAESAPKEIIALGDAPARWPDLVEDYALDRPFTSSPLRHSRIVLKHDRAPGDPDDLFLADADNRKSLRAFFAARLAPGTAFALTFSADTAAGAANGTSARVLHPAESAEAVIQGDPALRKLMELFEGRVLN